jgi:hypothetical protein
MVCNQKQATCQASCVAAGKLRAGYVMPSSAQKNLIQLDLPAKNQQGSKSEFC